MKKIIALLTVISLAVMTACAAPVSAPVPHVRDNTDNAGNSKDSEDKISVVATIFPPYDFARAVAGNTASVSMLLPPAAESHSYEPTPRDIILIQDCDLFIYNGGDSDAWVERILSSIDTSRIKVVKMIDCVETVEEEIVEGMEDDEDDHGAESDANEAETEEKHETDEHVWTSPRNAKIIVQRIADALCEVSPENAKIYQNNALDEEKSLDKLDEQFKTIVAEGKRDTIVFGDRFPFRYFADAYGLKYFAAFPGCSTETEAGAATVKFLIDKVKAERIPVIFHIELSNEKMADTIAAETGAKVLQLHACHNISKADFEAGKTYLNIMNENAAALREALS